MNEQDNYLLSLSEHLLKQAEQKARYIVAIAGPPGSGKTTLAAKLCCQLNQQSAKTIQESVVLPMDGFHYYKHELDQMEDPVYAHIRRGAPFTFNVEAFYECLKRIRRQEEVFAPSFDHG